MMIGFIQTLYSCTSCDIHSEEQKMTGLAAVAEESSAATEEIASASGEISDMATELKKEVERFSL
ncbi:hypothetical protein DSECCO2_08040 [anaerobic digester metagenome]